MMETANQAEMLASLDRWLHKDSTRGIWITKTPGGAQPYGFVVVTQPGQVEHRGRGATIPECVCSAFAHRRVPMAEGEA
jgi:hypothetical protein